MASQALTDYERQRLENIRRNDEMMAALKLQSKASELSAASKRQRYLSLSLSLVFALCIDLFIPLRFVMFIL
ncbi:WD repeat-containing protein 76 isoform X1 [Cucumis melo var. makuwa]|uniref:WD repeat-containing protein 76 isoform X1 n=1 Tax=Cucumis melo var. makuwa TaxID=1194695 RepID=A0A5A7U6P3_CUCMM|nr:WD repeat-containing protein 76 isoform X1 [Cucumis melo var. makuwa]